MAHTSYFPGATEMHGRVNAHDWAQTPLGPIASWSLSFKAQVAIVLASRYPMILAWGPNYTQIYNDGYSELIGSKHPEDLGADLRQSLAEGWSVLGPLVDSAIETGVATWLPALQLLLERHGYREESYFTVSHSPAIDDNGTRTGMLAVCNEVTQQVISERRLAMMRDLSVESETQQEVTNLAANLCEVIARNALDVPFVQLFLRDGDALRRVAGTDDAVLQEVDFWLSLGIRDDSGLVLDLPSSIASTGGPWGDRVTQAVCRPINPPNSDGSIGVIVYGISPNRELDAEYASFFPTLTRQVSAALGNAMALQSERQRVAALQELDRVKTAFFNNMSHEMRTPLNAIVGGSTLILDGNLDEQQHEFAQMIRTSSDHLLSIVNDFLDYAKLDARKVRYAAEPIEVRRWLTETTELVAVRAAERALELDAHTNADTPRYVVGDPGRLRQVLLNLLSNAVKFTNEGRVAVEVHHADNMLQFSVSDTGIGVAPSHLESIFEAFSQATQSVSTGTGLGLSISQALVEGMGGTIEVQSKVGAGTTFTVRVPAEVTNEAPSQNPSQVLDRNFALRYPQHILIAEDHPVNQRVLTALLDRLGFGADTVDVVEDGLAAVKAAQQRPYDLIFMDVQMPKLDGLAAARQIIDALDPATRPRIIALTANARHEDRAEAIAAGMDGYVAKPVTMDALVGALSGDLSMSQTSSASNDSDVIDHERLDSLAQVGDDFLRQLIDTYLTGGEQLIDVTETAVSEGRAHDVEAALHRLKGSSATVGANRLASLCETPLDLEGLTLHDLRTEFERVREALQASLDSR